MGVELVAVALCLTVGYLSYLNAKRMQRRDDHIESLQSALRDALISKQSPEAFRLERQSAFAEQSAQVAEEHRRRQHKIREEQKERDRKRKEDADAKAQALWNKRMRACPLDRQVQIVRRNSPPKPMDVKNETETSKG